MIRRKTMLVVAATVLLAVPAVALAQALPTPQETTYSYHPGVCWVTAGGPKFGVTTGHTTLDYGGWTACAGAYQAGSYKQVQTVVQAHTTGITWKNVTGTTLTSSLHTGTVRELGAYNDIKGVEYRVWAWAFLYEPNGYAGCSMHGKWGCYQKVVIGPVTTMGAVQT